MVAPVGSSPLSPLGQNWQQMDISPLEARGTQQGQAAPASATKVEQDSYGEPKRKTHTVRNVLIGLVVAIAAAWGLGKGLPKIKAIGNATEGWKFKVKQASEWTARNIEWPFKWIKSKTWGKNKPEASSPAGPTTPPIRPLEPA